MITSTANQQVKLLQQLNKKRKLRDERNIFLAEGGKMFGEAPRERLEKVYFSESYLAEHRDEMQREGLDGLNYEVLQDSVFRAVSDTQTPQGVLCIVRRKSYSLEQLLSVSKPLLLILENLQDPGNLGTILRTAEGAGVTGVILSKGCVDLYNPKTIRSTMGSIYRIPTLWAEELPPVVRTLQERGVRTCAAHLKGSLAYDEADYRGGTAFLIGNEGNGLSDELTGTADTLIRIPMGGQLESLNAAVAAAILMYEANRQRRK